jgi:hypothetical protein
MTFKSHIAYINVAFFMRKILSKFEQILIERFLNIMPFPILKNAHK